MSKIEKMLRRKLREGVTSLEEYVIDDILEQEDDYMQVYMEDVLNHGCVSGMVNGLIYYYDTVRFYKNYQEEINELLYQTMDDTGLSIDELFGDKYDDNDPLLLEQYNQNLMAWFGYETTMYNLASELGIY